MLNEEDRKILFLKSHQDQKLQVEIVSRFLPKSRK